MTERTPHIWTRINPDDPDTWPRPGNLVLVANDFGAVLNLRSFRYETDGGDTYINAYDEHGDYDDGMETPEELSWHPLPHPPIDPKDGVEHDTGWSGCCRG